MTNNFEEIKGMLNFTQPGEFYFLQVLCRGKDGCSNVGGRHANCVVKTYYITSLEMFESIKEEVIGLCVENNARAYIWLNKRNLNFISIMMAREMLEEASKKVVNNLEFNGNADLKGVIGNSLEHVRGMLNVESVEHPNKQFSHLAGKYPCCAKGERTWIIDIDEVEMNSLKVEKVVEILNRVEPFGVEKVVTKLKTKSGVHLITKPFNKMKFNNIVAAEILEEGEIVVKTENPTILFVS